MLFFEQVKCLFVQYTRKPWMMGGWSKRSKPKELCEYIVTIPNNHICSIQPYLSWGVEEGGGGGY